ncbi:MAG TPA: methylated-DNA--[protein]-cysteine S-methyltransferase [Usitatibacter sp.]|nr:methylated-DNA--[protein]-cysteine S-methyltransferase [Usitatibacter sp.]
MIRYARLKTPIGTLLATAKEGSLTGLYFDRQRHAPAIGDDWIVDPRAMPFERCARQVAEYLDGKRKSFDLPLAPEGSEFQRRVWTEIARIPHGATITYSELAKRVGAPGSARAAGAATGRNPISIVVPCHRVVGADGSLTGYAGGIERKAKLLQIEDARQGALA